MFRRSSQVFLASLVLAASAGGEDVARYLERHGLDDLLAVHLERQLETTGAQERDELIRRLVGVYKKLLETTTDPVGRRTLELRSEELLQKASESDRQELHLALLRGRQHAAEQIAERHRLRQAPEQAVARAGDILQEIVHELDRLRDRIKERRRRAERSLSRSRGRAAAQWREEMEQAARLSEECAFVLAWSLYYHAWLDQRLSGPETRRSVARRAEDLFTELLAVESARPQPEEISVDLREFEARARCILGVGLCKSMTTSSATAMRWLELLEHPRAYGPLREQLPAWQMSVHLEHAEFRAARAILESASADVPLAWIRLAAVHALEADPDQREAAELARVAVTSLAARGELGEVLDLADRYGVESLGAAGFAFRYVRGVKHYQEARGLHGSEEPVTDPQLVRLYEQAVGEFELALGEADAGRYPQATANCRWLIGWCRFFQGRFLEARRSFDKSAGELSRPQAAEALWMAVVSQDKAAQRAGSGRDDDELATLIDDYLARYPTSPRAPKLRLKRAMNGGVSVEVVEELLAIGPESDVYAAARRRAAQVLYQLFRGASGERRLAFGNEYLSVSLPLLDDAPGPGGDGKSVEEYVARSRRVLEVALAEGISRAGAAGGVLDALEAFDVDLSQYRSELDCRLVQERLLAGDAESAEVFADRLWERDRESVWARLAERVLFRHGAERWKSGEASAREAVYVDMVIRHGRRILSEYLDDPEALTRARVLAYHSTVAEALLERAETTGDRGQAAEALGVYELLLSAAPMDTRFLRATAVLSQRLGKVDQALSCWRTLVAGSPAQGQGWYEAKLNLITLLAEVEPARARAVMDQHKQLNPEYGPEPWASRFQELDKRIPGSSAP